MPAPPPPPAGLCNLCVHQRITRTGRGSVFTRCELAKTDPRFPKYPRVPVTRCAGFAPAQLSG